MALTAQRPPSLPRLRASTLFGRRPAERAEGLGVAVVQKPAQVRPVGNAEDVTNGRLPPTPARSDLGRSLKGGKHAYTGRVRKDQVRTKGYVWTARLPGRRSSGPGRDRTGRRADMLRWQFTMESFSCARSGGNAAALRDLSTSTRPDADWWDQVKRNFHRSGDWESNLVRPTEARPTHALTHKAAKFTSFGGHAPPGDTDPN